MSQQSMSKKVRLDNEDLKKEVECPICMEIPRTVPIYACPNGQLVCRSCKGKTWQRLRIYGIFSVRRLRKYSVLTSYV